jgi:hypothetical protein
MQTSAMQVSTLARFDMKNDLEVLGATSVGKHYTVRHFSVCQIDGWSLK